MTDIIRKIYCSHGDGGETSIGPIIGYHSKQWDAELYAKGRGWYGGNGAISKQDIITVDGKSYLLASSDPIDLDGAELKRKNEMILKALAKLTDEEIRILGLSKNDTKTNP